MPEFSGPSRPTQLGHKKVNTGVFRSIVTTRSQKIHEVDTTSPTKAPSPVKKPSEATRIQFHVPLGEITHNRERGRPIFQTQQGMEPSMLKGKRTKSAISLKGLTGKDKAKQPEETSPVKEKGKGFNRSKSSTNLAALLPRSKASKDEHKEDDLKVKNKENKPPTPTAAEQPPPIWAQFSRNGDVNASSVTKISLNDTWKCEEEALRYTPQEYSPSKGRNFFEQPSLRDRSQERPLSKSSKADAPSPSKERSTSTFGRLRKGSSASLKKGKAKEGSRDISNKTSSSRQATANEDALPKAPFGTSKGGSRVKAAVAALSGKTSKDESQASGIQEQKLSEVEVEDAFEKMLESRNIPPEVRGKMRALDGNMKADLIRQNSANSPILGNVCFPDSRQASRPGTAGRADSSFVSSQNEPEEQNAKKPRPRSLNFTFSKGDSTPSKKQKSGRNAPHTRNKSVELPRSTSSTSLNSVASSSSFKLFNRAPKPAIPDDFISYLRKEQKPQAVEVGKIQKLKQLLRNETVTWVDDFISEGGMTELVNLLYRIIEIEWREEHEDNLLHHTLTCLKALTTTSSALKQLDSLQSKLFPTLIALLFTSGEERKAPSEFQTRSLIISLIFSYLASSPTPSRASKILSYFRDPTPVESTQPLGFIVSMRRPRPYKLWCTELANVAKEVFWIFLHGVNVIPSPDPTAPGSYYCDAHFPALRPPVPAAPYVGSVEWDATTYLATHLDLLNGLIAATPTREERVVLRTELRDSGFEKVMGGQLRLCKEKFYGHVHAGLTTWVGAARDDGWDSKDVREGLPKEEGRRAKSSSPAKKKDKAPVLDMKVEVPKLDLGVGIGGGKSRNDDGWFD